MGSFNFNRQFQVRILALLCQDYDFLVFGQEVLEPSYFTNKVYANIFLIIRDYFQDYQLLIDETVMRQEFLKGIRRRTIKDTEVKIYSDTFKELFKRVPSKEYIQTEVIKFCRYQAIKNAILDSPKYLEVDDFEKVESMLKEAFNVGMTVTEIGMQYFNDYQLRSRRRFSRAETEIFPTGIPQLDYYLGGGLKAKQLGIWMGPANKGKCLKVGTPILKFDGSLINVEDVKEGDLLMGPDSLPRKVLGTTKGRGTLFKIIPEKGSSWTCNEAHILTLLDSEINKVEDIELNQFIADYPWAKIYYKQFTVGVEFPPLENPLPIDPYHLGKWFADRCSECVNLTKLFEIISSPREIPKAYWVASKKERQEFLAGFLDGGGYFNYETGAFTVIRRDKSIAQALCFIARSLGLCAILEPHPAEAEGIFWKITIEGQLDLLPFHIHSIPKESLNTQAHLTSISVQCVGQGDYAGFELNGDGRFLLGNFTVTHNSVALAHCGKRTIVSRRNVVHYSLEMSQDEVADRYDASFSSISTWDLVDHYQDVEKALGKCLNLYGNSLIIKEFPSGVATVDSLRSHLLKLQQINFFPDLIIVDYLDLLRPKIRRGERRHELSEITTDLRGLAVQLEVPIWSATQSNRQAISLETHTEEQIAEDYGKVGIADIIITINQTRKEVFDEIMRLFLAKNRNGPRYREVEVKTALKRMCFYDPFRSVSAGPEKKPPSTEKLKEKRRRKTKKDDVIDVAA